MRMRYIRANDYVDLSFD